MMEHKAAKMQYLNGPELQLYFLKVGVSFRVQADWIGINTAYEWLRKMYTNDKFGQLQGWAGISQKFTLMNQFRAGKGVQ